MTVCFYHLFAFLFVQIPLKLAYALSIHKAQGMTIDLLDVSLSSVFEYGMLNLWDARVQVCGFMLLNPLSGQVYVALSRATSLGRCRVTGFNPRNVKAHPRVLEFYRRLKKDFKAASPPVADRLPSSLVPAAATASKVLANPLASIPPRSTVIAPMETSVCAASPQVPAPAKYTPFPIRNIASSDVSHQPIASSCGGPIIAGAAAISPTFGDGFDELASAVLEG